MRPNLACAMSMVLLPAAALSANAADADVEAPEGCWQVQADVGYATSGPFSGWGVGFRALAVWRYLAVGTDIDTIGLGASGISTNSQPFEKSFRSTYGGALVRGRLPIGVVTPYAELGVGYAWIGSDTQTNTQCSYRSSIEPRWRRVPTFGSHVAWSSGCAGRPVDRVSQAAVPRGTAPGDSTSNPFSRSRWALAIAGSDLESRPRWRGLAGGVLAPAGEGAVGLDPTHEAAKYLPSCGVRLAPIAKGPSCGEYELQTTREEGDSVGSSGTLAGGWDSS